jgi:hypothetical protein
LSGNRLPLGKVTWAQRALALNYGIAPIHTGDVQSLRGRDGETNEMLEAMGYVDPDSPEDDNGADHAAAPAVTGGCEPPRK